MPCTFLPPTRSPFGRVTLGLFFASALLGSHPALGEQASGRPRSVPRAAPVGTEGNYAGSFSGDDQGIFHVTITADGQLFGLAFSISDQTNAAVLGSVQPTGTITFGVAGTDSSFSGSIDAAGNISGNWSATTGETGSFEGGRTFISASDLTGDYEGTTRGIESSTFSASIDSLGAISGTVVTGGQTTNVVGLATGKQEFMGADSDGFIFTGRFLVDGTGSGDVINPPTGQIVAKISAKRTTPLAPAFQALIAATPTEGPAPLTVAFDASGSLVPTGHTPASYRWNFGDGNTLTTSTATTTYIYTTEGVFNATLSIATDTGLSSPPAHQPILVGDGETDDTDLYLSQGTMNVNFAKHAKGTPSDQIKFSGYINPAGLPDDLSAASIRLKINDVSVAPGTGVRTRRSGAARAKTAGASFIPLLKSNGAFSLTLTGKDIRTFFDVRNATSAQTARTNFEIAVDGVTIDNPVARGVIETPIQATENTAAKGVFSHIKFGSRTGIFRSLKTGASRGSDGYKVIATGPIEGEFSTPLVPTDAITIILGGDGSPSTGETLNVPLASLVISGSGATSIVTYSQSLGEVAGLLKFQISNAKKKFVLATSELISTGIPDSGAGGTSHLLRVEIQVPTNPDLQRLITTVEIKRASTSSTIWKR